MRELTARAYQVSRLDEQEIRILHAREIELGYHGTPLMIHRKFQLADIGEVPEELYQLAESQVIAINEKARVQYREDHGGCCFKAKDGMYSGSDERCSQFPDLVVLHMADRKIRSDEIVFQTPSTGGRAREKMQGRVEVLG